MGNTKTTTKPELYQVMQVLYKDHGGFVKIMAGDNRKGSFYPTEELADSTTVTDALRCFDWTEKVLYTSIGTFKTPKNARLDNLLDVRAIPVDCDFHAVPGQESFDMRTALSYVKLMVMDKVIPEPTYIEYSRNLRLVYVLKEPFKLLKDTEIRKNCITLLRRLIYLLCKAVNDWDYKGFCFGAEEQRLTSFVRVPYSLNIRSQGHFDYDLFRYVIDNRHVYDVRIDWLGTVWDFSKLCESILPETFSGYEAWKKEQKAKKRESRMRTA